MDFKLFYYVFSFRFMLRQSERKSFKLYTRHQLEVEFFNELCFIVQTRLCLYPCTEFYGFSSWLSVETATKLEMEVSTVRHTLRTKLFQGLQTATR